MGKWYKTSKWRNLVDMHINDWNPDFMGSFDPQAYADDMETAKVDASELYTGNCLGICFFPTEVGHMHNGLKGKDMTGPTLDALKAKGLTRVAYFNMWCRWGFDTHPSWRLLDVNGKNSCELMNFGGQGRYGVCCPNNEDFKAYIGKQIQYLCDHYEFDGMWIDMIGWFIAVCHCPSCREKFMRLTGKEIPKKMDWKDPDWLAFHRFRQASFVEFVHVVDDVARVIKPDVAIAYQSGSWLSGWFCAPSDELMAMSDFLAADIYGTPLTSSVVCKSMNSLTANKPIEYMTSRCVNLYHHTINRSKAEMRLQIYGAIAHNAAFTFIDAINPDGTMDARLYRMMGELKQEFEPYFAYWRPDAKMEKDVVLYTNLNSLFDPRSDDMTRAFDVTSQLMGPAASLIGAHLTYDIALKKALPEACDAPRVIVVNNAYILDDDEVAALEKFVEEGGSVIVTGLSGMYSQQGFREDFALANLTGVHYDGETFEDVTYIRPDKQYGHLMPSFNDKYPMSVLSQAVKVKVDEGVDVLARLSLPWSHSKENDRFASAISNPPGIDTDLPTVTVKKYGKGRAMYIAMPVQDEDLSAVRDVFVSFIRYMMPRQPLLETNAPQWLELSLYRDGDRVQLMAYNAMDAYYVAVAPDVQVKVRLPKAPQSVVNAATGECLPFAYQDGVLALTLGDIESFGMFIIE